MVDEPGRRVRRRVSYRYPQYGAYRGYTGMADGSIGGLFRAAAEAAAELLVGGSRVASTWIVETSDAMFGRRAVGPTYEHFEEEELVESEAGVEGAVIEEDDEVVSYGPAYGAPTICDTFNRAFQDGARVVGRSAERFASEYDRYGAPPMVRRRRKVVVETEQTNDVKTAGVNVETETKKK